MDRHTADAFWPAGFAALVNTSAATIDSILAGFPADNLMTSPVNDRSSYRFVVPAIEFTYPLP
jgi:hypothetical protein